MWAGLALLGGQFLLQLLDKEPNWYMIVAAVSLAFGLPILLGVGNDNGDGDGRRDNRG